MLAETPPPQVLSSAESASGEHLAVPIAALVSFQQVTQQADAKGTTLVTVHVGVAALIATQAGELVISRIGSAGAVALWIISLLYLVSFIGCGYALVQAIRPRRAQSGHPNLFAFPPGAKSSGNEGNSSAPSPAPVDYAAQAWEMAHSIAAIAVEKNRYVAMAIGWTVIMVVSAVSWILLTTLCSR